MVTWATSKSSNSRGTRRKPWVYSWYATHLPTESKSSEGVGSAVGVALCIGGVALDIGGVAVAICRGGGGDMTSAHLMC